MSEQHFEIQIGAVGDENIIAIKPPVDQPFRDRMYDILDGLQLIRQVAVNDNFFATKHAADGSTYSELRVPTKQLVAQGASFIGLANNCKEILLEDPNNEAELDSVLRSSRNGRQIFDV